MGHLHLAKIRFRQLLLTLLLASAAHAKTQITDQLLESLATPAPEDMVLYRWGSRAAADNLIGAGVYSDKLYRHLNKKKYEWAGPGPYGAASLNSSAEYMKDGGRVVEIHIPKGTKLLRPSEPETWSKLR